MPLSNLERQIRSDFPWYLHPLCAYFKAFFKCKWTLSSTGSARSLKAAEWWLASCTISLALAQPHLVCLLSSLSIKHPQQCPRSLSISIHPRDIPRATPLRRSAKGLSFRLPSTAYPTTYISIRNASARRLRVFAHHQFRAISRTIV